MVKVIDYQYFYNMIFYKYNVCNKYWKRGFKLMKKLFSILLLACIVIPLQIQAISMEAIKNDKNNISILTGKNAITYFVDKSSIKRIEENQFIYKVQAVVYEVENNNSRRTNSYIHKVLVTYRYDINHSVASVLRTPQYAQDYSLLIYAKQASSGMKLTINSVEDFNYDGVALGAFSNIPEQYVDVALRDPKYVVGNYIFKEAYGTAFENMTLHKK